MLLTQALRYPFQGYGWFRRILLLTFLQLLPIVGQLILLGYGFDIARAVYAKQTDLPPIRWLPALGNGLRFLLAGLVYLIPILITIVIVGVSSIRSSKSSSNLSTLGLLLSIGVPLLLFLGGIVRARRTRSSSAQRPGTRGNGWRSLLKGLLPIVVTVLVILLLRMLVSGSGIESGKPNSLSILLFVVLALVLFLIVIVLYIGGVRFATENKGLLAPATNAKLLLQHRAATGMLVLNIVLLGVITFLATGVGLVLFVLPGLFVFVVCTLALWYIFARYSLAIRAQQPEFSVTHPDPIPSR